MNFHIMTLFPEMVSGGLNTSIIGRAISAGLITLDCVNIRDFTDDVHGHVDDYPYGGGAGMVMQAQPVFDCFRSIEKSIKERIQNDAGKNAGTGPEGTPGGKNKGVRVLYTSPAGRVFDQQMARELSVYDDVIILCGHYEGVDERALELIGAEEVSIGDYVLTGGELAAMVMVDSISRMVPGVLANAESSEDESFTQVSPSSEFTKKGRREVYGDLASKDSLTLLEYPQYTRPEEYMGLKVPEVLLSGHHENIEKWRRQQSLERTKKRRPDLIEDRKHEQQLRN